MNKNSLLFFPALMVGGVLLLVTAFSLSSFTLTTQPLTATLNPPSPPQCPFHEDFTPANVSPTSSLELRQEALLLKAFLVRVENCPDSYSLNTCLGLFQEYCVEQGKCSTHYSFDKPAVITSEIRSLLCSEWTKRYILLYQSSNWTYLQNLFTSKNTTISDWLKNNYTQYQSWRQGISTSTGGTGTGGTGTGGTGTGGTGTGGTGTGGTGTGGTGTGGTGTGTGGTGTGGTTITFTPESCAAYGQAMGVGNIYSCQFGQNCASNMVAGVCPIGGRIYFCCLTRPTKCSDLAKQGYACVSPYSGIRENCQPGTQLPGVICNEEYQVVCCKPKLPTKCVAVTTLSGYCGGQPRYNRDWKCVPAGPGENDDGCDVDLINPCRVKYGTYSGICDANYCVPSSECKGLVNNLYGCPDSTNVCCNYKIEEIPVNQTNMCKHICVKPYPNSQYPNDICGPKYYQVLDEKCSVSGYVCCASKNTNAECGNGILEQGEGCDDHNTSDGDGCSANCQIENNSSICGNGILESSEECDDHNTSDGDGCSSTCKKENKSTAVCGNGKIEEGEDCDNSVDKTCEDYGYNSGKVKCTSCKYDISDCYNTQNTCWYLKCENGECVSKETSDCPHADEGGCTGLGSLCGQDYCINHAKEGYGCSNNCQPDTEINAIGCESPLKCCKSCTPNCEGKECGDDGCGGFCGQCPASKPYCYSGKCSPAFQ